jgi:hypothetical protein
MYSHQPCLARIMCFGRDQRLAPFERMPAELVQHVFFLADMNPSLPRASVPLSRVLTDRFVLSQTCRKAFSQSNATTRAEQQRERQKLVRMQEDVFSMRWMTWPFFSWFLTWWVLLGPNSTPASCDVLVHGIATGTAAQSRHPIHPTILCAIPSKLLSAPFTPDKLEFLRCLLTISQTSVDWSNAAAVKQATHAKREGERSIFCLCEFFIC